MTVTDIVPIITALSALIGAIAAAVWGHGLANAKDEVIKAKDAQLEALRSTHEQVLEAKKTQIETLQQEVASYRELTPAKIREYFLSTKEQLEEYIEKLKDDLDKAQCVIEEKNAEIAGLNSSGKETSVELERLRGEREALLQQRAELSEKLKEDEADLEEARLGLELLSRMKEIKRQEAERARKGTCAACGHVNIPDAGFCANCGRALGQ